MWTLHSAVEESIMYITMLITSVVLILPLFINNNIEIGYKLIVMGAMAFVVIKGFVYTSKSNELFNNMWDDWNEINIWNDFHIRLLKEYSIGKDIRLFNMKNMIADKFAKINESYLSSMVDTNKNQLRYIVSSVVLNYSFWIIIYLYVIYAFMLGSIMRAMLRIFLVL